MFKEEGLEHNCAALLTAALLTAAVLNQLRICVRNKNKMHKLAAATLTLQSPADLFIFAAKVQS